MDFRSSFVFKFLLNKSSKFHDFSSLLFETVFYYRVYGKQSSSGVSWKECHPSERLSSVLIMIIQAAPSLMKSKVHFQFNACGHHHLRLMLLKFIIFTKILNDAKIFTNFIVTFLLIVIRGEFYKVWLPNNIDGFCWGESLALRSVWVNY